METRALCIAFFYAIGTAVGGITGPLLFGNLIENASASGDITGIALGYFIGAALMIVGGVVAIFLGVHAEGESLENIAKPLTAEDADSDGGDDGRRDDDRTPAPAEVRAPRSTRDARVRWSGGSAACLSRCPGRRRRP